VINLMDRLNLSDDELNAIADRFIDEAMSISIDEARCVAFTDEMAVLFARRLRDV
jgi:hypothetical protein